MLSNPTNNLHNRQRQHRRQQSTPNAFEPVKVSNLPNIQRHGGHRRGMSLDTRRRQSPPQERTVSNTNPGYQTTQQHILRETQQQRLARPGQQFVQFDNDENYHNSPAVTPQRQSFDAGCTGPYGEPAHQQHHQYPFSGPVNTMMGMNPNSFNGGNDFNLFPTDAPMTPSAYLDFSAAFENVSEGTSSGHHSRRSSAGRRISGGILDRVTQFESLALQSPGMARPLTPPIQNVASMFTICPQNPS
jgi:regulatory protein SWI5